VIDEASNETLGMMAPLRRRTVSEVVVSSASRVACLVPRVEPSGTGAAALRFD